MVQKYSDEPSSSSSAKHIQTHTSLAEWSQEFRNSVITEMMAGKKNVAGLLNLRIFHMCEKNLWFCIISEWATRLLLPVAAHGKFK